MEYQQINSTSCLCFLFIPRNPKRRAMLKLLCKNESDEEQSTINSNWNNLENVIVNVSYVLTKNERNRDYDSFVSIFFSSVFDRKIQ